MPMKEKIFTQPLLSGRDTSFSSNDRASLLEILQRSRRIETRLTRFLETEGISTGIQRPWWVEADGQVMIPSLMTTLDAILNTIPEGWPNKVEIVLKEDQDYTIMCDITV